MKDIKLYPHNQETYDKIQALWKTENKVAAVQATGTGKSYLILKCVYNAPEVNKVILAPSNYILEQIEKEAGEQLPNTKLLTYSKLSFMSDMEIESLNIEYIFLDEFHRCGAEQWGDGVQRLLNAFPDAKVLGTSATHIRFLDNARNMGEELFNGNIVNNLSLAEAIVKKILPMPKYISALYTFDDEVNNLKTKVENSKNDEESKKEMLKEIEIMKNKLNKSKGIPNILKKHLFKNYNGKFIIFCKDKIHLDEMKETVVEWFKQSKVTKEVNVYSVYSNYEYGNAEVDEFIENKNPKSVKLLFSIEMFNEGIHIEDVTGVILLRPTVSPIIYYQQIGRAMQAGKSATPVIFDLVNNFDNIGAKNFVEDLEKEVRKENEKIEDDDLVDSEENRYVDISEFMIFDETLEARDLFAKIEDSLIDNWDAMYKQLKLFILENGRINVPKNYEDKKLCAWVLYQRNRFKNNTLNAEKIQLLNELDFIWDVFDEQWNTNYKQLKDFYIEHDNIEIPDKTSGLYMWIRSQRLKFKKNELTKDQINQLNDLDFNWYPREDTSKIWDEMYNYLVKYKKNYGNCLVPDDYIVDNKKLGRWIKRQRSNYSDGKLFKKRIDLLNNLGFTWNILDEMWMEKFSLLVEYKEKNENMLFPDDLVYKNVKLGQWSVIQKISYNENKMSEERINLLNSINFVWNKLDFIWDYMYNLCLEYKKESGDYKIPQNLVFKNENIGKWILTQKKNHRKGTLTSDRLQKLNNGGLFDKKRKPLP